MIQDRAQSNIEEKKTWHDVSTWTWIEVLGPIVGPKEGHG